MSTITTDNKHYSDIASAIREKNGTATKYTPAEMASAIKALASGNNEQKYKIASGSFSPDRDTKSYTVTHNLGAIPKIIGAFNTKQTLSSVQSPNLMFLLGADFFPDGKLITSSRSWLSTTVERNPNNGFPESNYISNVTETELTIGSGSAGSNWSLNSGEEYFWFAVG